MTLLTKPLVGQINNIFIYLTNQHVVHRELKTYFDGYSKVIAKVFKLEGMTYVQLA